MDMYSINQTDRDVFSTLDKMYKSLYRRCIFVTVIYIFIFVFFRLWPLALYNILSIPFYIYLYQNKFHKRIGFYVTIMHFQIIIHAFSGVVFWGWNYEFQIVILAMISTVYIYRKDFAKNLIYLTYFEVFMFVMARMISVWTSPISQPLPLFISISNPQILYTIISSVNIAIAIFAIISIANINKHTNKLVFTRLNEDNIALDNLANIDPLTGLLNRRYIYRYIEKFELEETNNNLIVVIGDIDDFKDVNDTSGHDTGDLVIQTISEIIKHSKREIDLACRWGGDEFLIIMPDITIEEAYRIVDDIRQYISNKAFHYNKYRFKVTVSFGIANADKINKFSDALALADENLYKCKNQGKNQVKM